MPAIKYYEVTQTRKVRVAANDIQGAAIIADREFVKEDKNPPIVPEGEVWGHAAGSIEIINIDIRKELY